MKNNYISIKHVVFCCLVTFISLGTVVLHAQNVNAQDIEGPESNEMNELINKQTKELVSLGNNEEMERREVTSAISSVSGKELEKMNTINPGNSLYGLLPGLSVMQNAGSASYRDPSYFIRGLNTTGNNKIMVLIDGIVGDISRLSTLSIEKVEVLKDAAALAIYGQRGANGVLLVTTKRGVNQKMEVDINLEMGVHQASQLPKFLDAAGYAESVNEARLYDGLPSLYSRQDIEAYKNGSSPTFYPNVDWLNESLRDFGSQTNLNVGFRGGDDKVRYFAELDYRSENGLYKEYNSDDFSTQLKYDRINFRTNFDVELTNSTVFRAWVSGGIDETNMPGSGTSDIFSAMFNTPANAFPVKNHNANWGGTSVYGNNPAAMISSTGYNRYQGLDVVVQGALEQDISEFIDGLSAEIIVGHNMATTANDGLTKKYKYEHLTYQPATTDAPADTISQVFSENSELSSSTGNGALFRYTSFTSKIKYQREIKDHRLDAFLMYDQNKWVGKNQYNTYLRQNIAANMHYGYKNKYYADVTLSYGGAGVLPSGDRFSLYPAVSAAWLISEEDFIGENSAIKYLKLRSSFGYAGSDHIAQNTQDTQYTGGGSYYFGNNNVKNWDISEGRLGGDPKTERAMMVNLGVDANFFGSLAFTVDAFYNKRSNILVSSEGKVTSLMGVDAALQPIGEVENKGFEAALTWQDQLGDFKYSATGQFSFARNNILEMGERPQAYDYLKRTGHPIGQAFGLVSDGFFNSSEEIKESNPQLFSSLLPGDVKYRDQNGDEVINNFDEVAQGFSTRNPEIYYSLNLNVEYKHLGINALLQGAANQTLYLNTASVYRPLVNNNNISGFSENRWTESTAATATLPRLTSLSNDNNYRASDIWYASGNFLKLRNVELYYILPKSVVSSLRLENVKFFLRGTNLLSFDTIDQMDPEAIGGGYPPLRTYNAGIKLTF